MFTLSYSEEKNRIYIKLLNLLSEAEFEVYKTDIMNLIDNSKAGFTVLADLSPCSPAILARSDSFNIIREYGAKRGFQANALILSSESYELYNSNPRGNKNAFLTLEEAECYLDSFFQ